MIKVICIRESLFGFIILGGEEIILEVKYGGAVVEIRSWVVSYILSYKYNL